MFGVSGPGPAPETQGHLGETPKTLILAIHGVLQLHPWVRHSILDESLEEDAFSLIVKRTVAYGLGSFSRQSPSSAQWAHNDAGGDWAQDGAIHQLAWLQVALPSDGGQRVPIQPAARVLDDVLKRVGRFDLTGLHAVVPLKLASDSRVALAYAAGWFAVTDPASIRQFTVTLSAEPGARLRDLSSELLVAVREATHGAMSIEPSGSAPEHDPELGEPLAGEQQTAGMVAAATYRCTAGEWSLDTATWAVEVFIEALWVTGTRGPCFIKVSSPQ